MQARILFMMACLCASLLCPEGTFLGQEASAQKRQRPAAKKKPAPKKPKPPKLNLPTVGGKQNLRIAPVDENRTVAVKATAGFIDRLVDKNLKANGLSANPDATDEQFLRRIYLDVAGTIPTAKETQVFLRSHSPSKRERLIDDLLNRPEQASHQFNYWADLLRIVDRSGPNTYTRPFGEWLKQCLRDNKPYDELVRDVLTAEGKVFDNPAVGYTLRDPGMPLDHLDNTVRIFLGTRIGCAQCHDHPFDRWTQREFYQLAALVGGEMTTIPNRLPKNLLDKPDVPEPFDQGKLYQEITLQTREERAARKIIRLNRNAVWEHPYKKLAYPQDYAYDNAKPGDPVAPSVIFGPMPQLAAGQSRRDAFAAWVTSTENPRFALTIANRLWKRAFGVGLIEPEDDLRDDTEASNPELMQFLTAEMIRLEFNLNEFQRVIYNTQAYQRQVTYDELDPAKPYHFPGPILRRMTAEQVWDSLLTLTLENPNQYQRPSDQDYLEVISVDPAQATAQSLMAKGQQEQDWRTQETRDRRPYLYKGELLARASELPQPLPDGHFLRQFGQSDRQIIADGTTEGTVPQILTMFNGPVTHMMLERGSVIYNEVMEAKSRTEAVDLVFLSILNREPTARDRALAVKEINENKSAGMGNVIWALLNTREFLFIQ